MSTQKTLKLEYKIALLENHIESLHKRFDSLEQTMYALHNTSIDTFKKPLDTVNKKFEKHIAEVSDIVDDYNSQDDESDLVAENNDNKTTQEKQGGFKSQTKNITPIHTRSIS